MPLVKIDGHELEIQKGETVLNAAKRVGIEIPYYCYHPGLKIVASCRMCLIDQVGAPKLVPGCSTTVGELPPGKKIEDKYDAVFITDSEKVTTARRSVLEFLLLNHPIDCPICDKAGECKLQDYTYAHGNDASRLTEPKRVPLKKDLGPTISLYTSRCILCSRCARFTEEITGTEELKITHRGSHSEISIAPNRPLDNKMMGNVVDLCPVGCLIDKKEKFEGRVWNFVHTDSICPGCSKGCNTTLDTMKHEKLNLEELVDNVYRTRPRENMSVNQWWICDDGRYHLESDKTKKRILAPHKSQKETTWLDAIQSVVSVIKGTDANQLAFVGSPYASNEENYLLGKLAKAIGASIDMSSAVMGYTQTFATEKNKHPFTIEAEKAPNYRGAKDVLGLSGSSLEKTIPNKKTVIVLGGMNVDIAKPETLIVFGTFEDGLSVKADYVLPIALFTETSGTYTNKDGLVQKFNKAIHPHGEARPAWQVICDLAQALGQSFEFESIADVTLEIKETTSKYSGIEIEKLYPHLILENEQMVL